MSNSFFLDELPALDFKGEAITFRTTTAAVLDTLAHCAELVTQREEAWRKRLERETERRRRCESLSKSYFEQLQKMRIVHPGPDLEVICRTRNRVNRQKKIAGLSNLLNRKTLGLRFLITHAKIHST